MNEGLNSSNNRKAEIKIRKDFLTRENISQWMMRSYDDVSNPATIEAINKCIDVLFQFINTKNLDFAGMHNIFEAHRQFMTDSEYLTFINNSERIVRDFLRMEELESKERYYSLETEFILNKGFVLNERYIISFPDSPELPDEEWVISEFATGRNNVIRPVHGFKIKNNGDPYARAQYISMPRDNNYTITRVND